MRALLRTVGVLALLAGVVAMHSAGLGHQAMPMTVVSAERGLHSDGGHGTAAGSVTPACSPCSTALAERPAGLDHGLGAVCLAVVPLLLLLLGRLLVRRSEQLASWLLGGPAPVGRPRGSPPHVRPTLARLCVLRT